MIIDHFGVLNNLKMENSNVLFNKIEVEILLHYWHLIIVYLILKLDMPYPA